MATARFYVPTESLGDTLSSAFDTTELLSYSSTEIRLGVPGGATLAILYGQFNFTPEGELTGGTLTGLTTLLANGVNAEMVLSGMSVDLLTLVDLAFYGTENDLGNLLFGGADKFTGSSGADQLLSYKGNDTIDGGTGIDTMKGGNGSDLYIVRDIGDLVTETNASSSSGGIDTVNSYLGSYTLPINVENGRIKIDAGAKLVGNGLANVLTGGDGADILVGGAGKDTLQGGDGADIFRFNSTPSASNNIDKLADFHGADAIELENKVFTELVNTGVLATKHFVANSSGRAVDGNDFVVYETDTGKLFYDADGSGAGAAVQIALLTGAPTLSHLDIFVT